MRAPRSRCVAHKMRASTANARFSPTRRTSPSCKARRILAWSGSGISPISSRNSVPPLAASNKPGRAVAAPVNAPLPWPNSSDSRSSAGSAATLTATKAPRARPELAWRMRATTSLPVPVSPKIATGASLAAKRAARLRSDCMAALSATTSVAPLSDVATGRRPHTLQRALEQPRSMCSIMELAAAPRHRDSVRARRRQGQDESALVDGLDVVREAPVEGQEIAEAQLDRGLADVQTDAADQHLD